MTYLELRTEISNYVRVNSADMTSRINEFINESIIEFVRRNEWIHTKKVYELTLDGSDSYSVPTYFYGELGLYSTDREYDKKTYTRYVRETDKSYLYSIYNSYIYVSGSSGTLYFEYLTKGDPYPLSSDSDESEITSNYGDIIKRWAIWKYMKYIGDVDSANDEESTLSILLTNLVNSENRVKNNGKPRIISVHNR